MPYFADGPPHAPTPGLNILEKIDGWITWIVVEFLVPSVLLFVCIGLAVVLYSVLPAQPPVTAP